MSDKTCKTCKHWTPHHSSAWNMGPVCLKLSLMPSGVSRVLKVLPETVDLKSVNLLGTPEDFGCIHHEAKA